MTYKLSRVFLIGRFYVQYGLLGAGTIASMIPFILALVFQRYILTGLVASALKG